MKKEFKENSKTFIQNAEYALTLEQEFSKNIQLDKQETVIYQSKIKFYTFMLSNFGYLVLTNKRIVIIKHLFFRPDKVISIAFDSLKSIKNEKIKFNILNFPYTEIEIIHLESDIINTNIKFLESIKKRGKYFIPNNKKTIKLFKKLIKMSKKSKW